MTKETENVTAASSAQLRINPPMLMNEAEVAVFIGNCPRSVRIFTQRSLLPMIRLGRRRLFHRDAVLAAPRTLEDANPWTNTREATNASVPTATSAAAKNASTKYQRLRAARRHAPIVTIFSSRSTARQSSCRVTQWVTRRTGCVGGRGSQNELYPRLRAMNCTTSAKPVWKRPSMTGRTNSRATRYSPSAKSL